MYGSIPPPGVEGGCLMGGHLMEAQLYTGWYLIPIQQLNLVKMGTGDIFNIDDTLILPLSLLIEINPYLLQICTSYHLVIVQSVKLS